MKRFVRCFKTAAILCLIVTAAGCGGKQPSSDSSDNFEVNHSAGKLVDTATAGTISGTIHFEGVVPQMKVINMIDVPNCAKMHSTPVMTENFMPGENGTLQNVLVYLQGDFSAYSFPQASEPVKVDQKGCIYAPHVVALMTGDPLEVTNKDDVTHNINAMSQLHQGWNETQVQGGQPIVRRFSKEEIPMTVKCNMHPWMRFYAAVINHPYFQVTGKDGQFTLHNIPPGTYTLVAWHETLGIKKQTVIVQPRQEHPVLITFTDKDRP